MDLNAPAPWRLLLMPLVLAVGIVGLGLRVDWGLTRRAQRAWDRGEAGRQRRWAAEDRQHALQQQLREMEQQI